MDYGLILFPILIVIFVWLFRSRLPDEDKEAQKLLDDYVRSSHSMEEIGKLYERYVGHLYEVEGNDVVYNGILSGFEDLGRDLVVKRDGEIHIVQAKCWAKNKTIQEKHIFQLYGTMMHFKMTEANSYQNVKAVFYTTARYSERAQTVARTLGVDLQSTDLNRTYPMIKCNVSMSGEKIYHLPMDPYYDKVKIKPNQGEFYVSTVQEAVAKGFRRARNYKQAA